MAKRKSTPERKARSGANIPEEQRGTVQIKLRVLAAVDRELRRRAKASGMSLSAVVSALVMSSTTEERS